MIDLFLTLALAAAKPPPPPRKPPDRRDDMTQTDPCRRAFDDIDLWISDLETLPQTPEVQNAINSITAYAQFRESQSFQPEASADELPSPSADLSQTTDKQS